MKKKRKKGWDGTETVEDSEMITHHFHITIQNYKIV